MSKEALIVKLVETVTDWHKHKIEMIDTVLNQPADTDVILQGSDGHDVALSGDVLKGFRAGMVICKEWIEKLPFEATKTDGPSRELDLEPEAEPVQRVYMFTEDLGDGSSAVRYTQDAGLLRRLQSDDYEDSDYFQQNEGYSNVLTFPADIDLVACGFKFYEE